MVGLIGGHSIFRCRNIERKKPNSRGYAVKPISFSATVESGGLTLRDGILHAAVSPPEMAPEKEFLSSPSQAPVQEKKIPASVSKEIPPEVHRGTKGT